MSIDHPSTDGTLTPALEQSADVVAAILDSSHDGIVVADAVRDLEGRIIDFRWTAANDRAAAMFAMVPDQLVGSRIAELFPKFTRSALFRECCHVVEHGEVFRGDNCVINEDVDLSFTVLAAPTATGLAATLRNTTRTRKRRGQRDPGADNDLVGPRSREDLHRVVAQIVQHPSGGGPPTALLFIDLDRFNVINEALGHHVGDELLRTVSDRLESQMRGPDHVIHSGGDTFVAVVQQIDPGTVDAVVNRLLRCISAPVTLGPRTITASASIGVALADETNADAATLVRQAEAAMVRAKHHSGNRYEFFDHEVSARAAEHLDVELDLGPALRSGQFENYYQPLVELGTRERCGVETLVRWHHPTRGLVPPDLFIPVAEKSGRIVPLGRTVLGSAVEQFARWRDEGRTDIGMFAVNAAPTEIVSPRYAHDVLQALEAASIAPVMLSLEITETAFMQDPGSVLGTLRELSRAGVGVALDDFGTGFSSLTYLRDFPVTTIKIDKQFVWDIDAQHADRSLVAAVIALARSLGKFTVAEGVETERQAEILTEMGADFAQGYLFSRPKPAEEI